MVPAGPALPVTALARGMPDYRGACTVYARIRGGQVGFLPMLICNSDRADGPSSRLELRIVALIVFYRLPVHLLGPGMNKERTSRLIATFVSGLKRTGDRESSCFPDATQDKSRHLLPNLGPPPCRCETHPRPITNLCSSAALCFISLMDPAGCPWCKSPRGRLAVSQSLPVRRKPPIQPSISVLFRQKVDHAAKPRFTTNLLNAPILGRDTRSVSWFPSDLAFPLWTREPLINNSFPVPGC